MTAAADPKVSGIYRLTISRYDGPDRHYIGQAARIGKRWNHHLRALQKGTHFNLGLQLDYDKYGDGALSLKVLLICEPHKDVLAMYEQIAVNAHEPSELYNIRVRCVTSGLGTPASAERRAKVARALTGLKRSDETKAAISRAQAWKHTAEGRAKMSAAAKGRCPSAETRAKMRANTSFRRLPPGTYAKAAATRRLQRSVLRFSTEWVLF